MPLYTVEVTRIREQTEIATVQVEATDEDHANDLAHHINKDARLIWTDVEDAVDWRDDQYEAELLDDNDAGPEDPAMADAVVEL